MSAPRSIADLSADLADRAECFCRQYFPEGRKQGSYWQVGDTSGAKGQSLAIRLQAEGGRKAGSWTDYATGQYGDLIDLLHERLGSVTLKETLREARSFLGEAPCPAVPQDIRTRALPDAASSKRIGRARKLFAAGKPVLGTLAATYMQGRGITRLGPALRYHPRVFLWQGEDDSDLPQKAPALLAKITDNRGQITGCARVYLDPSTGGLAEIESPKRILGQLHGHAIRFWSGKACSGLIVGEGLENTLSVGTALPEFDLASCLTATHLGLFIPPPGIQRIWIARDNDEVGRNASMRLRNQLKSRGIACGDLVPAMGDFNDDLRAFGRDALRRSLLGAMKAQGLEIEDG
ncbi:toprim domain-containing protein (plasmid) [Phaeobacter sp. G2]|nr:toprim domain-containing protein [Phaeobacter sp. G2]